MLIADSIGYQWAVPSSNRSIPASVRDLPGWDLAFRVAGELTRRLARKADGMANSSRGLCLILLVSVLLLGGPSCSGESPGDDSRENTGTASMALACRENGLANTCSPRCPCASGWGDCEPGECAAGLACTEDVGARFGFQPLFDVCLPPHCSNAMQDQDETASDSGGSCGVCPPNGANDACNSPSCPCESGHGDCEGDADCAAGLACTHDVGARFGFGAAVDVCLAPHCSNGTQDGDETDIDSGGSCGVLPECAPDGAAGACSSPFCLCENGHGDCDSDADCAPGLACVDDVGARFGYGPHTDVCLAQHCSNGVQDGDETAADSGGSCGTCPANGTNDTCSPGCACPSGWGDCDFDVDCQPGLHCLNDMGRDVGLPSTTDVCLVPRATYVEAGDGFNCVLRQDRSVRCWGANGSGESMAPPGKFTQVSAGTDHACGLKVDGTVDCWGSKADPPPPDRFTHISVGGDFTCGVKADATIACWGLAFTSPPPAAFSQVAAGRNHVCGLTLDGTIACWGPWQTQPQLTGTFTQVATGLDVTCALGTDQRVVCWRANNGQVEFDGKGFKQIDPGPGFCGVRVDGTLHCALQSPPAGTFTQVSSGGFGVDSPQACAIKTDGSVVCWGDNRYGQSMALSTTFTQVVGGQWFCAIVGIDRFASCWDPRSVGSSERGGPFVQVSAGMVHACGVRDDRSVDCWGNNQWGESSPPPGTFSEVASGGAHTCGLRTDGTTVCWGLNNSGQINAPAAVLVQLSAGAFHSCGLRTDGTVVCWGNDDFGQLRAPAGTFAQVSSANGHNCAVRTDGTVACWGLNDYGQATPPRGTFARVFAGDMHTCGVKTNGTAACWGRNDDPRYPDRVPTSGQATPLTGVFTQIASGSTSTCGLRPTGTLACWGSAFRDP
jgi:alpha-tubulin suppressor-like RCC1 family protein